MSSALLRQALEFVDQDQESDKKKKSSRKTRKSTSSTKDRHTPYQYKPKVTLPANTNPRSASVEDKVAKLLQLSAGVADANVTDKIIERAVKGAALSDYIAVPRDKAEGQSILFAEETHKKFEEELFCS